MNEGNNKVMMSVVALVIGVLVGGGIGYTVGNKNETTNTAMTSDSSMSMQATSSTDGVTVGGAKMVQNKDIVDNAAAADNVKTVVSLVKLAGLADTLKSEGPFTVFGPNDSAFAKIDSATVASLQQPENVDVLKNILTYHVVAGTYTSADLRVMATKGETLTSVQGQKLTPVLEGNMVKIKNAKESVVTIETADIISSNGVTHVIGSVLMPN